MLVHSNRLMSFTSTVQLDFFRTLHGSMANVRLNNFTKGCRRFIFLLLCLGTLVTMVPVPWIADNVMVTTPINNCTQHNNTNNLHSNNTNNLQHNNTNHLQHNNLHNNTQRNATNCVSKRFPLSSLFIKLYHYSGFSD